MRTKQQLREHLHTYAQIGVALGLLMALFNAPVTMSHYYYNKAQNALNDWYTGGIANEN